jgi:hypothetical protein
LSCNGSGLAWTSSSAGKKLAAPLLATPPNDEIGETLLKDETGVASSKAKAGLDAFMDAAFMDETGVALNGEADMTSNLEQDSWLDCRVFEQWRNQSSFAFYSPKRFCSRRPRLSRKANRSSRNSGV